MRIAILGAGAVGRASAAYLITRGHEQVIWSPSGKSAAAFRDGQLAVEGEIAGAFRLTITDSAKAAMEGAELIMSGYRHQRTACPWRLRAPGSPASGWQGQCRSCLGHHPVAIEAGRAVRGPHQHDPQVGRYGFITQRGGCGGGRLSKGLW
jgi:hypothetical protein